jgi:acetyl-CoA acetyltransferase
MVSQMEDLPPRARSAVPAPRPSPRPGIMHKDVDHLMIHDAFAHLPIYGLEDLGFVPRGEAGAFIAEHNTASGGNLRLPLNTNGGGLSSCIPACTAFTRFK